MSEDESSKSKAPKLQPETDRGGSGRPPRKTAIGYFAEGEDDDSHRNKPNLRFGQKMVVRTVASVIGGYRVQIRDTSVDAFLKTDKTLGKNILLSVVFKEFTSSGMPTFILGQSENENFVDGKPIIRRFQSETVDTSHFKYKRCSDYLPMSIGTAFEQLNFEEINIKRFITSVSAPNFSGCIRFSSQQLLARGYMVMLVGRCIRAEYRCASETFGRNTEESILAILDNLVEEDAVVEVVNLEKKLVIPLGAPFLGTFDSWHLKREDENLVQIALDWFKYGDTRTGMIYFQSEHGAAWTAFYKGRFIGFFDVESQVFSKETGWLERYIENSHELDMQTYLLPNSSVGNKYDLGYDLVNLQE
ncbi:hypothetical protein KA183_07930 [bacterium]|nr:hypothetical protein [bacterium]QQR58392.1 MAG: hypothetical protein IPG59_02535 [Candidatus Melainabacteria bacterium]